MEQPYSCPNCKSPITFGDRFCGACGIYLNWPAQQMSAPRSYQQPPGYNYHYYQQPGWEPPSALGHYADQQQQNFYGYSPRVTNHKGSSSRSILLIVLVVFMMSAGAIGIMTGGTFDIGNLNIIPSNSSPSDSIQPNDSSQDTTPVVVPEKIEITAQELIEAYIADGETAEKEYKDKIYAITGIVASYSIAEPYFVLLTSSGSPDEVGAKCIFTQASVSRIQNLETGQTVTLEGKVGDYDVDILVNDCIFSN